MIPIYEKCPSYINELISLRQTNEGDAIELMDCYSDDKAVPLFNSDNCNGDNFHYKTVERMKQAIEFWNFSYKRKYFVRWTIIFNETNEKIGTIEMFHRNADDEFNHYGVLRIDLKSKYEARSVINEILDIAEERFFELFDVHAILTKAIPLASERIEALLQKGYQPLNKKLLVYDDYFVKYK
jgi:[ribosomal protein S5]-alanine N-acetyltransferase